MKVSIIVPVYNVSKYIEDCLHSIANQTYDNIECILVDDCGNDNSMEICERFVASYKGKIRFHIVHHKKNRGLSASRNTGTDIATGEYVYYLDSDDKLYPQCLELLIAETIKHPNVEMVVGEIVASPMKEFYSFANFKNMDYVDSPNWMRRNYFNTTKVFPVNAWNKLVKRQFLIDNKISFKEGLIHEDVLWMYWMALRLQRISFVHCPTYFHLTTENSIMTTTTVERTVKNWGIIFSEILHNLEEPYMKNVLLFYLPTFVRLYRFSGKVLNYETYFKLFCSHLKQTKLYFISNILLVYKYTKMHKIRGSNMIFNFLSRIYFKLNYK